MAYDAIHIKNHCYFFVHLAKLENENMLLQKKR
jgi:hypothetical protein